MNNVNNKDSVNDVSHIPTASEILALSVLQLEAIRKAYQDVVGKPAWKSATRALSDVYYQHMDDDTLEALETAVSLKTPYHENYLIAAVRWLYLAEMETQNLAKIQLNAIRKPWAARTLSSTNHIPEKS